MDGSDLTGAVVCENTHRPAPLLGRPEVGSLVFSIPGDPCLICRTGSGEGPDCWVPAEVSVASRSGCPTEAVVGPRGRMAIRGRMGVLVATVLPSVLNGYTSIEARMTSTGEGKSR